MIKKTTFIGMFFVLMISFIVFTPENAEAFCPPGQYSMNVGNDFKCQNLQAGGSAIDTRGGSAPEWVKNFSGFLLNLATVVAYLAEILAMLTIAYAAFLYTTSEGDARRISESKTLVMYAFVGMLIGAFSIVIINMVGGALL